MGREDLGVFRHFVREARMNEINKIKIISPARVYKQRYEVVPYGSEGEGVDFGSKFTAGAR